MERNGMRSRVIFCYNAVEDRAFEVETIQNVEHMYRRCFDRIFLHLNFRSNQGVNDFSDEQLKQICSNRILEMMDTENMWHDRHSFYIIDYKTFIDDVQRYHDDDIAEWLDDDDFVAWDDDSIISNDSAYTSSEESDESSHERLEDISFSSGNWSMNSSF